MSHIKSIFNNHLNKYQDQYKIFKTNDDIYSIKCRYGIIQPFSLKKQLLIFVGTFQSKRKKSAFLKIKPSSCEIIQDCETECSLKFPETKLKELENYLQIKKKRILTEEQKLVLTNRIAQARLVKVIPGV